MKKKYFFHNDNGPQGPYTKEELNGFNLKPDTPVWYQELKDWVLLKEADELKDMIEDTSPEPETEKEEKNTEYNSTENFTTGSEQKSSQSETSSNPVRPQSSSTQSPKKEEKVSLSTRIFKTIGIAVVVILVAFLLFNWLAPDKLKKEVYDAFGIDNPLVTDYTVYIEIEGGCEQGVLKKKWHAAGVMWSTHPDKAFSEVTIRFHFSDGYEDEVFYKDLSPNNLIQKRPWIATISGHKDAVFKYMEVVGVK